MDKEGKTSFRHNGVVWDGIEWYYFNMVLGFIAWSAVGCCVESDVVMVWGATGHMRLNIESLACR